MAYEPFWAVWNDNGGAPTYRHSSRESAVKEAERLAREIPGTAFHILMSLGKVVKSDMRWEHADIEMRCGDSDVPF